MFLTKWFARAARTAARPRPAGFRPGLESLDGRVVPSAAFGRGPGGFGGSGLFGSFLGQDVTATRLAVLAVRQAEVGAAARVEVAAVDEFGRVDRDYTGTVTLSSSGAAATGLPAEYTFTAADRGRHAFTVTFGTAGSQTLSATDGTLTGERAVTVNPAAVATHFLVVAQSPAEVGSPARVAVVALDASNHAVRNFTGTVTLTSTDGAATLPGSYTFTAADRGAHVFEVTYGTEGTQTVTATADGGLTGSASVTVNPARVATGFAVLTRDRAAVGQPTFVTGVAVGADGRPVRSFTGTVTLSTSDTAATGLPATYTFTAADRGVRTFAVTFNTTGRQTVTAAAPDLTSGTAATEVGTGFGRPRRGFRW